MLTKDALTESWVIATYSNMEAANRHYELLEEWKKSHKGSNNPYDPYPASVEIEKIEHGIDWYDVEECFFDSTYPV